MIHLKASNDRVLYWMPPLKKKLGKTYSCENTICKYGLTNSVFRESKCFAISTFNLIVSTS